MSRLTKHFMKFLLISLVLIFSSHLCYADVNEDVHKYYESNKYFDEGLTYIRTGKYEQAIEAFEKAIELKPDDADLFKSLGLAYMSIEQWGKASEAFKGAVRLKSDDVGTHNNLGLVYLLMHRPEFAIEAYRGAVRLDPNNADAHVGLGESYLLLNTYEQAIDECRIAFSIDTNSTTCYLTMGMSYFNLKQYDRAIESIEEALKVNPNDTGYNMLGRSLAAVNKYEQAVEAFNKAININPDYGDAHYRLAITYSLLNDITTSLEHSKTALEIYNNLSDKEGKANVLLEIARTNLQHGNDINAMNNLQEALALYHEIGNLRGEGDALSEISYVYSLLQEHEAALEYLKKALSIYQQLSDIDSIVISRLQIAEIEFYLTNKFSKDYDELIKYINQTINVVETSKSEISGIRGLVGYVYLSLGKAYMEMHDYEAAKKYAAKIFEIAEENNDKHLSSYAFFLMGEIFDESGYYSKAIDYYLRSINLSGDYYPIHSRLGRIYNKLNEFNKSEVHYIRAINIIEEKRESTQSLAARMSLAINTNEIYSDTILVFLKNNNTEEAFNYMERAKARTFLDLLGTRFRLQDKNIFEEERRLQFRINYLSEKIREGHEKPDKDEHPQMKIALEKQLTEARTEYVALIEKIKKENPEICTLLTVNSLTLKQVQDLLDPETTLLEYFITPDKTLLWVVGKSDLKVIEIEIKDKELKAKVTAFRDKIAHLEPEYSKDADELYDLLIKPAKEYIKTKRVGIVPHSVLHYLPFHALLNKDKFLIEEYEMFYTPSASVLKFVYEKRKEVKGGILAFGNPDLGDELLNLPYAEDEVKQIKLANPGTAVYLKDGATEDRAKKLSSDYNVLHFASHGELNPAAPMFSSIRLAKDKNEDGRLEVNEIFNLNLKNTSLVTLSACETGLGKLTNGDELIGLSRGFIYAGTPSIVASLWRVNDQSTSQLMNLFYENLKTHPKSESLRMAQLEMIRGKTGKGIVRGVGGITSSKEAKLKAEVKTDPQSSQTVNGSHPYFWAPFILIGDWK